LNRNRWVYQLNRIIVYKNLINYYCNYINPILEYNKNRLISIKVLKYGYQNYIKTSIKLNNSNHNKSDISVKKNRPQLFLYKTIKCMLLGHILIIVLYNKYIKKIYYSHIRIKLK